MADCQDVGKPTTDGGADTRQLATESAMNASGEGSFALRLSAARRALCLADSGAIDWYKSALRAQPRALVGWREIAACYEVLGQHHASAVALACGVQAACANSSDGGSTRAAPLYLQKAASKLVAGRADEGLSFVGEAFRAGKGCVVGHVLRGIMSLQLGKDKMATQAFVKAREAADPAVTLFVERFAETQALGVAEN